MRRVFTALTAASMGGFAAAALVHLGTWIFVPPPALVKWLVVCAIVLLLPAGVVSRQIALAQPLGRAFTAEAQGWTRPITILVYATFGNAALHLVILMAASFGGEIPIPGHDIRVLRMLMAFMATFYATAWAIWDSRRRAGPQ